MKILGIDFGAKRVGLALADSKAGMAFPKAVVPNDKFLLGELKDICKKEGVEKIIIGESKDLEGRANPIMRDIEMFKKMLEMDLKVEVAYEPEFYTSAQAARLQGENDMIDASAAAIILQSFIDKQRK
jgi:putative Holliday junction resolvase